MHKLINKFKYKHQIEHWILIILIISMLLIGFGFGYYIGSPVQVSADSGLTTTELITTRANTWGVRNPSTAYSTWAQIIDGYTPETCDNTVGYSAAIRYVGGGTHLYEYNLYWVGFDISALNISSIQSAKVSICVGAVNGTKDAEIGIYTIHTTKKTGFVSADTWLARDEMVAGPFIGDYFGRLGTLRMSNTLTGGYTYNDFNIDETGALNFLKPDINGMVWICVAPDYIMTPSEGNNPEQDGWVDTNTCSVDCTPSGSQFAKLSITYVAGATAGNVTIPTNGSTGTALAVPVINSISWVSPRCAFANDIGTATGTGAVAFDIAGTNYSVCKLEINDPNGKVLASGQDMIRSGTNAGHFYWLTRISNYTGWFRCRETQTGKLSTWGYMAAAAPASAYWPNNDIRMKYMSDPYIRKFSDYAVNATDMFIVYYRTNINGSTEAANFGFYIYRNGLFEEAQVYNKSFTWIKANILMNNATNDSMVGWRFLIFSFTQPSGFDSHDGLIQNLNVSANPVNYGYYLPAVIKLSDMSVYTTTSTAPWYIDNGSQGIDCTSEKVNYKASEKIKGNIAIGSNCQALTYLNDLDMVLVNSSKIDIDTLGSEEITSVNTSYETTAPGAYDDYYLSFRFNKPSPGTYEIYTYRYDLKINVSGSGDGKGNPTSTSGANPTVTNIVDLLNQILKDHGADNPAGHGIAVLVSWIGGIGLIFVFTMQHPNFRVLLWGCWTILVFAVSLLVEWIDIWAIALLALGAGFTVWGIFKKGGIKGS